MSDSGDEDLRRLQGAGAARQEVLGELLERERPRLRRMITLRMDERLRERIDASDVVQEAFVEVTARMSDYLRDPVMPFHLWVRLTAGQQLIAHHRQHLEAQMRDVSKQVSIDRAPTPQVSSVAVADLLLAADTTPTGAAVRGELREQLVGALEEMSALDREILVLRHYEQLTNGDVARLLGISKTAAGNRYVRALRRLGRILGGAPRGDAP